MQVKPSHATFAESSYVTPLDSSITSEESMGIQLNEEILHTLNEIDIEYVLLFDYQNLHRSKYD